MFTPHPASQSRNNNQDAKSEPSLRSSVNDLPKGQNYWVTEELPGSRDHVSAGRSLCSFSLERLHDRDDRGEHRLVRPASRKGRATCTSGPTCGTRHGSSCATPCHGSPCAA